MKINIDKRLRFDIQNDIMNHAGKLTEHVMVRLSPRDHKRLAQASKKLGVKPTVFARIVLLNYLTAMETDAEEAQ